MRIPIPNAHSYFFIAPAITSCWKWDQTEFQQTAIYSDKKMAHRSCPTKYFNLTLKLQYAKCMSQIIKKQTYVYSLWRVSPNWGTSVEQSSQKHTRKSSKLQIIKIQFSLVRCPWVARLTKMHWSRVVYFTTYVVVISCVTNINMFLWIYSFCFWAHKHPGEE